jgi:WD40 repeat protein
VCESLLYTQSKRGLMSLWDIENENPLPLVEVQAEQHSFCKFDIVGSINATSSQCQGTMIAAPAVGGSDIGLWDTRTNEFQIRFRPFQGADNRKSNTAGMCTALCAAGCGNLIGAHEDGSVRLWDTRHPDPVSSLKLHTEPIFALSSAPLECRTPSAIPKLVLVSGGADGCIVNSHVSLCGSAPDPPAGPPPAALSEAARTALGGAGPRGVNSLSVRADGRIAAAGCWDGRVRVYACRRPRLLASLRCHTKAVQCVQFSPAGRWLASASEDTRIALWDVYSDEQAAGSSASGGSSPPLEEARTGADAGGGAE